MFEEYRRQSDGSYLQQAGNNIDFLADGLHDEQHFLGLTPGQRFVVALVILMMTIILGVLFLLVTNRSVIPSIG
jgi:hypothetical protein